MNSASSLVSAHLPLLFCQSNHLGRSNAALSRKRSRERAQKVSPLSVSCSKLKQREEEIDGMFKQQDRGHGSCGKELAQSQHLNSLGRMAPGGRHQVLIKQARNEYRVTGPLPCLKCDFIASFRLLL